MDCNQTDRLGQGLVALADRRISQHLEALERLSATEKTYGISVGEAELVIIVVARARWKYCVLDSGHLYVALPVAPKNAVQHPCVGRIRTREIHL
jgi:hypothetical protein